MIIAVLETRCGISLAGNDVYLNVAGGLRIAEPAADLAVATALLSAVSDHPAPRESVMFGEIGLSGAIRAVGQTALRVKEAAKLGFCEAILPTHIKEKKPGDQTAAVSIRHTEIDHLRDLVALVRVSAENPERRAASGNA